MKFIQFTLHHERARRTIDALTVLEYLWEDRGKQGKNSCSVGWQFCRFYDSWSLSSSTSMSLITIYKRTADELRSRKFFTCSFIRDKSRDAIRTGYVGFLPSFKILVENVDNMRDTFDIGANCPEKCPGI